MASETARQRLVARCIVIHPVLRHARDCARLRMRSWRTPEARLEEAIRLARTIGLDVIVAEVVRVARWKPAVLLGKGTVDALARTVAENAVEVAVIDAPVTPVQQRNLERAWACKVIDRTGLILEIFGARARTRDGRLQVELAALTYQRSRLVRSWTHLERQRGGFGFLGGPGESQLEIDRRLITDRIAVLKEALAGVRRTRQIHRGARKRVPYPIVALVGYTNAGKSTLFNRLTRAEVSSADRLFETLDPTMRRIDLPSGRPAILSDTVGFISDLPTSLVAAFHATLEEVSEADLIVHVRDVHHPDSDAQREDVYRVLSELGLAARVDEGLIEVLNKIDLLPQVERNALLNQTWRNEAAVPVSALTGQGCDQLLGLLDERLDGHAPVRVDVKLSDGAALAWLYRHGTVIRRKDDERVAHLEVRLSPAELGRFNARHAGDETRRR